MTSSPDSLRAPQMALTEAGAMRCYWSMKLPALPIPELSLNKFLSGKGHWGRAKWKDAQAEKWLLLLSDRKEPPPQFQYPVAIHIRLTGTGRKTDVQNWVAHFGLKVLIDCLTEPKGKKTFGLGWLKDDSMRYVKTFVVEVVPDGEEATEVEIWAS